MNLFDEIKQTAGQRQTRRVFLGRAAQGVGAAALASLLNPRSLFASPANTDKWTGFINPPHVTPRIKRVIWLTMAGGPSHLETFDYKTKLAEMDGKPMPESMTAGQQVAQLQGQKLFCFGPQTKFKRYGKCGAHITDLFPGVGSVADDICIVRSMMSDAINHDPAHTFMNTGSQIVGRPSMGSCRWASGVRRNPSRRVNGLRDFCRAVSKGCNCAAKVIPCCTCKARPASRAANRVMSFTRSMRSMRSTMPSSMIRRLPRASHNMKWRFRCRRACPN
jgi:hypothetical protein